MRFCFGLQQERLCKTDLSGLKLSVNITSPCSKLLCTEVREAFRNQALVFRTWIIRQDNTVRVHKLTEIVISLWLEIIKLDKEWFNVILLCGAILEYHIWNKWENESVNRSLTLINQQLLRKKKGTELDSKWKISKFSVLHFFKKCLQDISPLCGPLFWTCGDVFHGFQSQGGSPPLHTLLPVHNRIPRFTSGVTPADLMFLPPSTQCLDPMKLWEGKVLQSCLSDCLSVCPCDHCPWCHWSVTDHMGTPRTCSN